MVKKVKTSKKTNVHKVNSQKNKRKTRRNRKKTGGASLDSIQESLVSMVYDGNFPGEENNRRETWLNKIKKLTEEKVYFFFQGTGCSNNSSNLLLTKSRFVFKENRKYDDEYSFLKENNIKYGAEICRGNVIQQVMTSIASARFCIIPLLVASPLIRSLSKLIKDIAKKEKKNKVFLYGHSYGGTLVTRLMQELKDTPYVYGRTFGSPYIRPQPRLLHFVYDKDEIIQEQNICAGDENIVIKLNAKIPCNDGSVPGDDTPPCTLNDIVQGNKRQLYHWKTQLGWAHHIAYFPIMTYVIGNIDNKVGTVQKEDIKEELNSAVKNSGLFGFGLRNQILTQIKGQFYSFEGCKVNKCYDWIEEKDKNGNVIERPVEKKECKNKNPNNKELAKIINDCSVNYTKSQINSIS